MTGLSAPGGYAVVLRHPVARRLLLTKIVSEIGDFVGLAALLLLTFDRSGSLVATGAVFAARSLPALVVAGLLGHLMDRVAPRDGLVWLSLIGAAAMALPATAPSTATAILASALLGATRAAEMSLAAAFAVERLDRAIRLPYFALAGTLNQAAMVAGLSVGSGIALAAGTRSALLVDIASFVVGAVLLAGLPVASRQDRPRVRSSIGSGWRCVFGHPVMRPLALLAWATTASADVPEAFAPGIGRGAWITALLVASAVGCGLVLAVLGRGRFLESTSRQVQLAALSGVALLAGGVSLALDAPTGLVVLANLLAGAGGAWLAAAQATFANLAPEGRMGEIEAVMVAGNIFVGGLGALALGAVASHAGRPGTAYIVAGVLTLVTAAAILRRVSESDRNPASSRGN